MTAHIVLPRITGGENVPATLSPAILNGILRQKLGFEGLIVTDAMDMKSIDQGPGLVMDTLAALAAGADLVLFNHEDLRRPLEVFQALMQAAHRGLLSAAEVKASASRIIGLKDWLKGSKQPPISVVGCREHQELARQVADRSVTLVRDARKLLPLRLPATANVAVVVPRPEDLTVADTSSYTVPALPAAVRRRHPRVDEFLIPMNPPASQIGTLAAQLRRYDLLIVGTINAATHPGQAAFVNAVLEQGSPTIVIALRLPYDLAAFPQAPTYACTYSILPPSMEAIAEALWGQIPFSGQLPVSIPSMVEGAAHA
jgi:beta-N-acetylhexosaminidase